MRDAFVGIMFAVSFFLVLYKGFTYLENYAFNLAGIFLVGVALFPMEWNCGDACGRISLHGTLSVLFFLSIAYVCIFRASDTLGLMPDQAAAKRFQRTYRLLGAGMIVSPVIAVILSIILQPHSAARSTIFFSEAASVYIFAAYWIVKSREVAKTDSETLAIEGKLVTRHYRAADIFNQIYVDRVHAESTQ